MTLQPFVGPWPLQFRNHVYTVGRTPWTSDETAARPLPKHRTTQTQNKRTHRHPFLEWDSNPLFQRSSERRQFITSVVLNSVIRKVSCTAKTNFSLMLNCKGTGRGGP
jgi:hypothetical protein